MTAKLVSEDSQAFSASAFAMGFLGSCFGTCVPRGIWACFAEHFVSNVTEICVDNETTCREGCRGLLSLTLSPISSHVFLPLGQLQSSCITSYPGWGLEK